MSVKAYIYALVENILAQVNADARHKATYTTLFIKQMLVAHVNALAAAGVITSDGATSEEAWLMLSEKLKLAGWASIEASLDPSGVGPQKLISADEFPWLLAA